jgi:hypothetical protein
MSNAKKLGINLAELLKKTTLPQIIASAQIVSNRLNFLRSLEILIFDKDAKEQLLERVQLHKNIIERRHPRTHHAERKCVLRVAEPQGCGLRGQQLLHSTSNDPAKSGLDLGRLNFEPGDFGSRFGAHRKVFADALPVQPTGNAIGDFPGGIREFGDNERRLFFLLFGRLATSAGKAVAGFSKFGELRLGHNGGEGGIRTHGAFRHSAFRVRCDRPLCHLSGAEGRKRRARPRKRKQKITGLSGTLRMGACYRRERAGRA